jgi:hypothetical protein
MRLIPILPKRPVIDMRRLDERVHARLRDFGMEFVEKMEEYPPAIPWKGRRPKSGPRRGGRRTLALKRGWPLGFRMGRWEVTVENTVKYVPFVQGRGQTRHMRRRHWQRTDEVVKRLWPKHRKRIAEALAGK